MKHKKHKEVKWSIPSSFTNLGEKKYKLQIKLSKEGERLAEDIDIYIDHSLIDLLIANLNRLKHCYQELFKFLQYSDYRLFERALDTRNLKIVNYLLNNLSKEQCFIMLQYNDYAFIKKFIKINKNLELNTDFESKTVPILTAILKVQPNWETTTAIEAVLSDTSSPSNGGVKY